MESKIIGPLTFKQFIFIAIAGAICFFIYSVAPFPVFVISAVIFGGGALALAFSTIQGRSLPIVLANLLKFNLAPKVYIWKKRKIPIKIIKKEVELIKTTEETPLKTSRNSQIKKLQTFIETKRD